MKAIEWVVVSFFKEAKQLQSTKTLSIQKERSGQRKKEFLFKGELQNCRAQVELFCILKMIQEKHVV